MAHLANPLVSPEQLASSRRINDALPESAQDLIRFSTARLTQAAGILLRLPQSVSAQAVVLLYRYWTVEELTRDEFKDISATVVYLTAKVSAHPRSLRSIANVYTYLYSSSSALASVQSQDSKSPPDPASYYLSPSSYTSFTNRILLLEGYVLNALGFGVHVALPHPLAITYLQTMDIFSAAYSKSTGPKLARRAIALLNTALLSPQMLYLTHQPNALAVAAIYLAAREEGVNLPSVEWWEVFDVEREELGFLVVAFLSLQGWCAEMGKEAIGAMRKVDIAKLAGGELDEEAEMAMMLDEKPV
ncbi:hypothetical protein V495_04068 [Pseudogymnoascus sp. VKM F-4514 (FW-929)]|nr:hypothetical protein V490_01656 [Pseudogymnoascus sp. VKM F-3557]KFY43256.1 hypothetical protein V495_04068 [Pseudogymnoascus sp. VKM F-4514 (FW-929)]KFY60696.1 hypothetical protein V497_03428 [Pseudogymnoascus sp. VKM F-4516 (FW-969)]